MRHARKLRAASAALRSVRPWVLAVLMLVSARAGSPGSPSADGGRLLSHPTAGFTYRVPEGWTSGPLPGRPDVIQVASATALVRFVVQKGELGLDVAHVLCMDERLADPMATSAGTEYEDDFLTNVVAGRHTAFSSLVVAYDAPIMGYRVWWQRNRTIVGGGETICVMGTMPDKLRRKRKRLRHELESIMDGMSFELPAVKAK